TPELQNPDPRPQSCPQALVLSPQFQAPVGPVPVPTNPKCPTPRSLKTNA
ncbi:hypothetical protein SARC_15379, partial [Sphaeroforma arctica JP610]